jgi:hypothetical protein
MESMHVHGDQEYNAAGSYCALVDKDNNATYHGDFIVLSPCYNAASEA